MTTRSASTNTRIEATTPWRCLILAGGRSSRMGRDKALLKISGQPLLDLLVQRMQAAGASEVRVSGDYPGHRGIPDIRRELGPLGGLWSALNEAAAGIWVILAVDMPLIDGAHLQPLLAHRASADALCYRGHVLPLRLQLNPRVRDAIVSLVEQRGAAHARSLRALHQMLDGETLACPATLENGLVNCNTPSEWEAVVP